MSNDATSVPARKAAPKKTLAVAPSTTDVPSHAEDEVSPTLIQLFVRPIEGERLGGQFFDHLYESGFGTNPNDLPYGALLSEDEGKVFATLRPSRPTCFNDWKEAVAAIDPHNGAVEYMVGTRFVSALRCYASAHGGAIFDGAGRRLSDDELAGLEQHLDGISKKRWRDSFPKREKLADGSYVESRGLSYTLDRYSNRGKYLGSNYFDIPEPATENDGWEKGIEMCREMFQFRQAHHIKHLDMPRIISDAVAAQANRVERPRTARASSAFLHCLDAMLSFAARNCDFSVYFDRQIQQHRKSVAYVAELDAREKAEFVKRMQAARAAKRAQRQGDAA